MLNTSLRLVATLLATGLLGVASSDAEVRLKTTGSGRLTGHVLPGAAGPWSVVGNADAYTLNPLGDLRGDGAPAFASDGGQTLAVWSNRLNQELSLSRGDALGWGAVLDVPAPSIVGTPWVVTTLDGMVALWQAVDSDGTPSLGVTYLGAAGEAVSMPVAGGRFLSAWATEDQALALLATDAQGGGLDYVVLAIPSKPIIPIPIGRFELGSEPLGNAWSAELAAGLETVKVKDWRESIDVLYWWGVADELWFVELDTDGEPAGSASVLQRARGGSDSRALIRAALREVKSRPR